MEGFNEDGQRAGQLDRPHAETVPPSQPVAALSGVPRGAREMPRGTPLWFRVSPRVPAPDSVFAALERRRTPDDSYGGAETVRLIVRATPFAEGRPLVIRGGYEQPAVNHHRPGHLGEQSSGPGGFDRAFAPTHVAPRSPAQPVGDEKHSHHGEGSRVDVRLISHDSSGVRSVLDARKQCKFGRALKRNP